MMSLFSPFDFFFFHWNYLIFFLFFLILSVSFWALNLSLVPSTNLNFLILFFLSLKPKMFTKFTLNLVLSFLFILIYLNFFSVFSFIFPMTSSFGGVMFISLSIWLGMILFSLARSMEMFLSHLVPEGSPIGLTFVLFLIETVSMIIRPITLTVRLVANILAGHLLMILLSKLVFFYFPVILMYSFLNLVEIFVALIQSYIFCTMFTLYFSEVH